MEEGSQEITIQEFAKLDLRIAIVTAVEPHPNADKLIKLHVDLGGGESRQLVAGIAGHYESESLVGRRICVVTNLKPAKLRGELSQGMLLAASDGPTISLLAPDQDVAPGSKIS
jgi:methionyl-tRNA synthetase